MRNYLRSLPSIFTQQWHSIVIFCEALNMSWYGFKPYVSVAKRRNQAARKIALLKKKGQAVQPVVLEGRTITKTFWGNAWCKNLETYSDYENRLPRGRTYVRNGSVIDLNVGKGEIKALVSGS